MSLKAKGKIIACHECDQLYHYEPISVSGMASCTQCGAELYRHVKNSLDRGIALYLTALMLFILANVYPFLSLELGGRVEENILLSSGIAMYQMGMPDLGILIFFTSIGFPFISIISMLYILIPLRLGIVPPAMGLFYRLVEAINPWSLVSVFMLGVLISIVKLQDLANVITGPSLYALVGLLVAFAAARANFDPESIWEHFDYKSPDLTDPKRLMNCHTCGLLTTTKPGLEE
ncbi:MAG: paraquat-inducible protein A, partial [Gammaproteobacteria bacterium]|nr:paraquat-inducible protein A [Gammaproteobacteria bacterium]